MGRSVSYPYGAHVAYAEWDQGRIDDENDSGTAHYDDSEARQDWDCIVDSFRDAVLTHYPSTWSVDDWIGREDRVVARNAYACFGLSEYCGCIAYWVVLRGRVDAGREGLAERWFSQIERSFEKRFATLERLGTLSNGETVFRVIA